MSHHSSMSNHFAGRKPLPHEVQRRPHHPNPAGDFIPMPIPPNFRHPLFAETSREEHHHYHQNRTPVYQGRPHQPPHHHHHTRPNLPTYQEHVLNRRREDNLKAMIEDFMEIQRKSNQRLETRLEFLRYDLDGKFENLSDQVERVESRCIEVEEELKKQAATVGDNTKAIRDMSLNSKEMDSHLDEKITSLEDDLNGTTESLNSIALVAHQAKKRASEVNQKEQELYTTMLVLVEGQKQFKVLLYDLKNHVEERYKTLLERTTLLQDTTGGVSKGVKDLTKRLEDMEEKSRASRDTKAADSKPNNALVAFGVRETDPRVIWDEDERGQEKRTARIRGRRLPDGTPLAPRTSPPPLPKEKRKARSSVDYILDDFHFIARRFPCNMPFDIACNKSPYLQDFVWNNDWSLAEVERMYDEARKGMPKPRTLHKLHDPGYFLIHCSINGKYFDDALCDSGSSVNLMPAVIARSLGFIESMERTNMGIKLANSSSFKPLGKVKDVQLDFEDCIIPADFYVVTMEDPEDQALLLGRSFLATAGAIMDWPNRRISLANVDKDTYYVAAPPGFSSKRFRYTSGGEGSQQGYLIKEVLQDKMHLEPSSTRSFLQPPYLPNT